MSESVGTDSSFFPSQGGDYFLEVFDSTFSILNVLHLIETLLFLKVHTRIVTAEVTAPLHLRNSTHIIEAIATGSGIYEFSLDQGPWQDPGLFYDIESR